MNHIKKVNEMVNENLDGLNVYPAESHQQKPEYVVKRGVRKNGRVSFEDEETCYSLEDAEQYVKSHINMKYNRNDMQKYQIYEVKFIESIEL